MTLAEVLLSPSWTFVVIVLGVVYRPQIAAVLTRIRVIRGPGGWEGEFGPKPRR